MKNILTNLISITFCVIASAFQSFAAREVSILEINGMQYYAYEVKRGDSLFGIAREEGWDDNKLQDLNIDAIAPLKRGMRIFYPLSQNVQTNENGQNRIEQVRFRSLKVTGKETWQSIAQSEGVNENLLKSANPGVSSPKKNQIIAIPIISNNIVSKDETHANVEAFDNKNSAKAKTIDLNPVFSDLKSDVVTALPYSVRVAIIIENQASKRDMEYVRGFIAGLESFKRSGMKISLKVINGSEDSSDVTNELKGFRPNLIFATHEKSIPSYLNQYASDNNTLIVNTFDVKSNDYEQNQYIIQLMSPSNLFNDNVAAYIKQRYEDYTLLVTGPEDPQDQLGSALVKGWSPDMTKFIVDEDIRAGRFRPDGQYLIYSSYTKQSDVSDLLTKVAAVREERPMADIYVIGRPNWITLEKLLQEKLHSAYTLMPSRFYVDKDSEEYRKFERNYKSLYSREPAATLPMYAAVGYDTAIYFLPQMFKTEGDINEFTKSSDTVQSGFDLVKMTSRGGYLNLPVYLVRFTPFNTVDKVLIDLQ